MELRAKAAARRNGRRASPCCSAESARTLPKTVPPCNAGYRPSFGPFSAATGRLSAESAARSGRPQPVAPSVEPEQRGGHEYDRKDHLVDGAPAKAREQLARGERADGHRAEHQEIVE